MSWFNKPNPKEQMRKQDRALKKTERDIDRDRRQLERQEKQLEIEIKKAAKMGNKQACTVLAKQLVQMRKQKQRTYTVGSNVMAVRGQAKAMQSNVAVANAMASTTKVFYHRLHVITTHSHALNHTLQTMGDMNKQMNPMKLAQDMEAYKRANAQMDMKDEIINDTLDEIMEGSDDEAEADSVVNKVLEEIGIEIKGQVSKAPAAHTGELGEASGEAPGISDADLDRMLQQLKS